MTHSNQLNQKSSQKERSAVTIGLIQMSVVKDPQTNLRKAVAQVEEAAHQGAKIICLQELFSSPYFPQVEDPQYFELAESIPGPLTQTFSKIARAKKVVLVIPVFEKRADGVYYNSAVVIDADGSLLGTYRKMHIPDDPSFYEKYYFTPGDLGFQVFETKYAKIGVLICWDQWFPEAARLEALQGAEILFYPTAIGWNQKEGRRHNEEAAWETVQRAHAIANGVYVATANRVGVEENLNFWGQSFVADPLGVLVAQASDNREEILLAECDFSKIDKIRQSWPFFRDRRVDAYRGIVERFAGNT